MKTKTETDQQRAFQTTFENAGQHLQPSMESEFRLSRDSTHRPSIPSPGGHRLGLRPVRGQRVPGRGLSRSRLDADDRAGRRAGLAHAQPLR